MTLVASKAAKAGATQAVKHRLKDPPIGELVDTLFEIREEKRAKEEELKEIEARYNAAEQRLMEKLETEKTEKGSGKYASCSISSSVVPQVEDWDALYKFIARTKYFHLLQRRPSTAACRELFESKGSIPGVTPVVVKKLNLRST